MNEAERSWPESRIVDHALHQRLARALRDAALDLAFQQLRIDHRADIVDHGVIHQLDLAGIGIDLDLAEMAAIGEGVLRRREGAGLVKPGSMPFGNLLG